MKRSFWAACLAIFPLTAMPGATKARLTFPAEGLNAVAIRTDGGRIEVSGADGGEVQVEVLSPKPARCALVTEVVGRALVLQAKEAGGSEKGCPAGFRVRAPSSVGLEAASRRGRIRVSDMSGGVKLNADQGPAEVHGISGDLDAELQAGTLRGEAPCGWVRVVDGASSVELKGLRGLAQVSVGENMRLEWSEAPPSGEVRVKSDEGSITLVFPRQTRLRADLFSATGKVINEFDAGEGLLVFARAGSSIALRKAKEK